MKRYIYCAEELPHELTVNGIDVIVNSDPFAMYNKVFKQGFRDDSQPFSIEQRMEFIEDITEAIRAEVSEQLILKFDLFVQVSFFVFESHNHTPYATAHVVSNVIKPKIYRGSREGWTDNCPYFSTTSLPATDLSSFRGEIKDFIRFCDRTTRSARKFKVDYANLPIEVCQAADMFNYWITKEHLGYNDVDEEGKEWLLSRTVNNNRSYIPREEGRKLIDALFDYAVANDLSYEELAKLCRRCTEYRKRNK